jgi:apolipoprotein N-acyltransferase
MKKFPALFLSLLSGLLLFAAWPVSPLSILLFFAFVPLLWLEHQGTSRSRFFGFTYLAMLTWNLGSTWWICEASLGGGLLAILINPLLMCIPWIGFFNLKKRMGPWVGYAALVCFWMTFEYIHLNWELSWPWLTLGNGFATHPNWVQWYEFSGAAGGTAWILGVNLAMFRLLKQAAQTRKIKVLKILVPILLILLPLSLSYVLLGLRNSVPSEAGASSSNVVVVQPNIDPYDKFAQGKEESELLELIRLSKSQIDSNTALVVWPETAIPLQINEDSLKSNPFIRPVWDFLRQFPRLSLLTGMEGFRFFKEANKSPYSEKISGTENYVDSYNSALLMDSGSFSIYHKSKLVPGVETIPSYFRFLVSWFAKFGGATGSYARQADRTVLVEAHGPYRVAPAVCYESIFGEFMSAYIRNGASLIVIITNDGWWGNTPGYRQHENYARLRAIETRRWVVRCANTGISCFIDPEGRVWDAQGWDIPTAVKMKVPPFTGLSFYSLHGDLLFKAAVFITLCLGIWNLVLLIKRRFS